MKTYESENIRNIVLAGHASKGKTTLAEALLNVAGATERLGKVADGTTVTDYDSEEKKRHISVFGASAYGGDCGGRCCMLLHAEGPVHPVFSRQADYCDLWLSWSLIAYCRSGSDQQTGGCFV